MIADCPSAARLINNPIDPQRLRHFSKFSPCQRKDLWVNKHSFVLAHNADEADQWGSVTENLECLRSSRILIFSLRSLISAYNSIITYSFCALFGGDNLYAYFSLFRFSWYFHTVPELCQQMLRWSVRKFCKSAHVQTESQFHFHLPTVFAVHGKFRFGHVC